MGSAMRAEVKLETIHQETSKGLTDVHKDTTQTLEILEVVRRDVSALRITAAAATTRSDDSSGTSSDEFDRNIIIFAQSTSTTSAPMLRTPDVITEELKMTAYIKGQINGIATMVEQMSVLPSAAPHCVEKFQMSQILEYSSMSITCLRQHVAGQVTSIRDFLHSSDRTQPISIQQCASALTDLSAGLRNLNMGHESILVGKWAINHARMLASGGAQPDVNATVALYLLNQSMCYQASGDRVQGLQAIAEAYTLAQNLRNDHRGENHFQILYGNVLLQHANFVNHQQSITMCIEAIQVFGAVLNVQAFTRSELYGKAGRVVPLSASFFDHLFLLNSTTAISAITSYAHALQHLGAFLCLDSQPRSALDLMFLAIVVWRKIVSIYGCKYKVKLAWGLWSLLQNRVAGFISAEQRVSMAEECAQLLRELAGMNPALYARRLGSVLWQKAMTQQSMGRNVEAIGTWEKVAELAQQIVQDSRLHADALGRLSDQFRRLERYDDAVRTGTLAITTYQEDTQTQASRYFYLSQDLLQLRRYKESIEAVEKSVTLCRCLAKSDPEKWMGYLTLGLSKLVDALLATGDLPQARQICKERSIYISQRVEIKIGEYRELVPTLRMLGVLCCSEGQHEEGAAAAKELSRIMTMLGTEYPNLEYQIKEKLAKQHKAPVLKALEEKLDCEHQTEAVAREEPKVASWWPGSVGGWGLSARVQKLFGGRSHDQ